MTAATRPSVIRKSAAALRVPPHLAEYESVRSAFSWDAMRRELGVVPGGFVNIGYAAVDRHLATPVCDRVAFRFVARDLRRRDVTYLELARLTNRFANVLRGLGVGRGDRVFVLAGRIPELYVAMLGALKNGSVVTPLFSAFGPEPIKTRLALGEAKVLVTSETLYARKIAGIAGELPQLEHIVLVGEGGNQTRIRGTHDWATEMDRSADSFDAELTSAE